VGLGMRNRHVMGVHDPPRLPKEQDVPYPTRVRILSVAWPANQFARIVGGMASPGPPSGLPPVGGPPRGLPPVGGPPRGPPPGMPPGYGSAAGLVTLSVWMQFLWLFPHAADRQGVAHPLECHQECLQVDRPVVPHLECHQGVPPMCVCFL
jgi:hypothetical protein